jgi:hypothetical protein
MMRNARSTEGQRESSGYTVPLVPWLPMVAAVAVIIAMPSLSAAQEPAESCRGLLLT